jgi:hypothetical protein
MPRVSKETWSPMRSLIVGTRSVKVRRGPSTGTRFSSVTVTISTRGVSSRVIVVAEIEVELCVLIGELRNPMKVVLE